jgi:hypothetical protein
MQIQLEVLLTSNAGGEMITWLGLGIPISYRFYHIT